MRFVLLAAFGDAERVDEFAVIFPELELGERRAAGEEVKDGTDQGLLLLGENDARGRSHVLIVDLELARACGRHSRGLLLLGWSV